MPSIRQEMPIVFLMQVGGEVGNVNDQLVASGSQTASLSRYLVVVA